jgi:tRNA dimethylallyltransferase
MNAPKSLIVIVGPTASGKSALAVEVAQHFHTEIVSADSRQVYREMNIAVAKPTLEELTAVKHHFIGSVSIHDQFSAGSFADQARATLDEIFSKHDIAVLVGGSGLYINAVIDGLDDLPGDENVRQELRNTFEVNGIESLQIMLKDLDPEYHEAVDLANPHRVMRALEVIKITGKKYSTQRTGTRKPLPFRVVKIGLTAQREYLYERINKRVDQMIKDGLMEEAKALYPHRELAALQTVGYSEIFDAIEGKITWDAAIEKIKQHTRQYAKRQLTWWRRDQDVQWAAIDQGGQLLGFVKSIIQR